MEMLTLNHLDGGVFTSHEDRTKLPWRWVERNKDKLEKTHFCDCSVDIFPLSSPVVNASLG